MTTHPWKIILGLTATALIIVLPTAALAESTGSIDHVESGNGQTKVLFSVTDLAKDQLLDPASVQVSIDGESLDSQAERISDDTGAVRRTSVLAIDVSNSMAGPRFAAAKQAALTYIDHAPKDVYIALVTYASTVDTVQKPSKNHASLAAAVNSLQLTTQTHLYDGVQRAIDIAGTKGQRSVLLLSDGKDTTNTALETITAVLESDEVQVDVVALDQTVYPGSPLQRIADASGGTVTSIRDLDDLNALFAKEADALAKQLLITFVTPALARGEGNLSVSVDSGGSAYADGAYVAFPSAVSEATETPSYAPTATGLSVPRPIMFAGIALLFLGLGTLLAFGMTMAMPAQVSAMQQQLALYTADGMKNSRKRSRAGLSGRSQLKDSALRMAEGLVQTRDFETALSGRLDRAGMTFTAAEWLLLHVGIAIGAALFGLFLSGGSLMLTLLLFAAGALLPWLFLSFKATRRIKAFNSALAQTLQIIAGALQAGLSLPQAVDTVVQEGDPAVGSEFRRAIVEQRLGVNIEDSLDTVAERMKSNDFKWVVMAIRIQREVGGNLAELLLTVSATLREREYLRRQVQVLSAEGKLSAYILGGLPPFFMLYLTIVRPEYLQPMLHTGLGHLLLGVAAAMMAVGMFWMKQTVKVEV